LIDDLKGLNATLTMDKTAVTCPSAGMLRVREAPIIRPGRMDGT
jgi:hypothetical protein